MLFGKLDVKAPLDGALLRNHRRRDDGSGTGGRESQRNSDEKPSWQSSLYAAARPALRPEIFLIIEGAERRAPGRRVSAATTHGGRI